MQYVLTVENFLKIEKAEIPLDPGVVGLVGDNAQGKTTIITALHELLAGKNDFSKVRNGADRAVIRLDAMEDGNVVSTVQRVQTTSGSRLEAKGLKIGHTATTFLSSILNEIAINPISLISSNPVEYLKKHLDVAVDEMDYPVAARKLLSELPQGINGFLAAELVAKKLEEERLFTRKTMEQAQSVVRDMRSGMPSSCPAEPTDTVEKIKAEQDALQAQRTEIAVLTEKKTQAFKRFSQATQRRNACRVQMNTLDEQIKALQAQAEIFRQQMVGYEQELAESDAAHQAITVPTADQLEAGFASLKDRAQKIQDYRMTMERFAALDKRQLEVETLAARFDQQDQDVKTIRYELPKLLLTRCNLGVDGIEIRDGQLFVNGFHIERLSTAERAVATVKIAIGIAKRKGHVAVCLDGVESLDASHREEFLKAAKDSGVCVIYTRAGKPELTFEREVKEGKVLQ